MLPIGDILMLAIILRLLPHASDLIKDVQKEASDLAATGDKSAALTDAAQLLEDAAKAIRDAI